MTDLSVKYMGLELRNPIIVGSSGLTNSIKDIQHAAKSGAGAIVLKSIFEEQIRLETDKFIGHENEKMDPFRIGYNDLLSKRSFDYAEAEAYIADFAREHTLSQYLKFIEEAKKAVDRACSVSDAIVSTKHCEVFGGFIRKVPV